MLSEAPLHGIEQFLLDQVQAAVIATDTKGVLTHWNRHAEVLFGWEKAEALGAPLLDLIVADEDRQTVLGILECLRAGESWQGELAAARKDGGEILTRLRASPTRDHGGEITGMAGVLVDITDLKRAERRLEAQYAVTRVLAEAESLAEATPRILRAVAESLGWEVGAIWEINRAGTGLHCVATWKAPDLEAKEFEALTNQIIFSPGIGLPGRVWTNREPAWIPDVVSDENFPRAAIAAREGLHGAFAFPITLGSEILGVVEFFSREIREPEEDLLDMTRAIGSQIGQFIERKEAEQAVRQSESRKSAILEGSLDCVITIDHQGMILEFNQAAEKTFGHSRDDVLGRELAELLIPPRLRERHREGLARYLESGVGPLLEKRVELSALRADGTEFPVELAINRIPNEEPPVFTGYLRDITRRRESEAERTRLLGTEQAARAEAEEAREQMAFIAEVSTILAGSLDYRKTLTKVARLAVPRLAEWCSVDIQEDDGTIRQYGVAHVDADKLVLAKELRERFPLDPATAFGTPNVIRTGAAELYPEIPDEVLVSLAADEEHLRLLRALGFRSAMMVPLTARGRTFGGITFVISSSDRRYDEQDLELAGHLARRAAQAVDNARLYQDRARVARALQQSLLPQGTPSIPGFEVAARYHAAGEGNDVGGDFYDLFEAGDRAWFVVIGDVQGKGPEAAAVTGLARHTIRAAATNERNPSRILRTLNRAILAEWTDRFATVALARIQHMNGGAQLAVSCGGHPPPLVLTADGEVHPAEARGHLLGVFPDVELSDQLMELSPGDVVLFYTDGVIEEREPGKIFGEARLIDLLRQSAGQSADAVADRIEQAVLDFKEEPPRDDIAIVVVRLVSPALAGQPEPV